MDESEWLSEQFEAHRAYLEAVAFRMLGSTDDADDALQEAWLRLSGSDPDAIVNVGGWLTTIVARVCLNMLRSRRARSDHEESLADHRPDALVGLDGPEHDAVLAEGIGLALLTVLDSLSPAERVAFVLHDMFDLPFDEVAPIVNRSPAAARQLASRARRRIQGKPVVAEPDLARQRQAVDAFLAAARRGDFQALVAVLDPDVVLRADRSAVPEGAPTTARGARDVAQRALAFSAQARFAQPTLVNGQVGIVVAPRGRLFVVLGFHFRGTQIVSIDVIADPERLRRLDLAVLDSDRHAGGRGSASVHGPSAGSAE